MISWQVPSEAHIKSSGFGPAFVPPGNAFGSSTVRINSPILTEVETPDPESLDSEPYVKVRQDSSSLRAPDWKKGLKKR